MKHLLASFLLVTSLPAFAQTGDEILKKVITHPGTYEQMCGQCYEKTDIPYQAFALSLYGEASFSKKNAALIQANRETLIQEIRKTLSKIDFSRKPKEFDQDLQPDPPSVKGEPYGSPYGYDPASLNPLLVKLIYDLKGLETLPDLLILEEALHQHNLRCTMDIHVAPPFLDGWEVYDQSHDLETRTYEGQDWDRYDLVFQGKSAQRSLIVLMQMLMRDAKYQPALENALERAYQTELAATAKKEGWLKYDASEKGEFIYIEHQPQTDIYRPAYTNLDIPYSEETRTAVRASAQQWVKEHP